MSVHSALLALVLVPLLAACVAVLVRGAGARWVAGLSMLIAPALLVPVTASVASGTTVVVMLGGFDAPLGVRLVCDALAVLMLWLSTLVTGFAGIAALAARSDGGRDWFWPLWLVIIAGCNALVLSADLFNLYVALELVVLAATPLIATAGSAEAIRAAMRYLLLAMLASLAYLMGIALLYSAHGTLDLYLLGGVVSDGWSDRAALALVTTGLLLKTAIFPLHIWLAPAHSSAPGPVSAVLSALVVKVSLYLIYRLWMWTGAGLDTDALFTLFGLLGVCAITYGSVAALMQQRLKLVVAYSTVAQLGYLMLVFPLAGLTAWQGANYFLLSHGLAKAAMFIAAANLIAVVRNDRVDGLAGCDRIDPISVFAFGLAGIGIMGLPPSGGFIAKWTLLQAAIDQQGWGWLAVLLLGSLLAAAYVLRVLAAAIASRPDTAGPRGSVAPLGARVAALTLALLSIGAGFAASPVYELLALGAPPGFAR